MGFRSGAYLKVWQVEVKSPTNTKIRASSSKKNKETGTYEQDWSGFISCAGTSAAKKAANLKEGDRIRIKDCDVTTTYNKEKNVTYTNYAIFNFLTENESGFASSSAETHEDPAPTKPVDDGEPDESGLPF